MTLKVHYRNGYSKAKIESWIQSHYGMKSRMEYLDNDGFRLIYENGDTYEIKYRGESCFYWVLVLINSKLAQESKRR